MWYWYELFIIGMITYAIMYFIKFYVLRDKNESK